MILTYDYYKNTLSTNMELPNTNSGKGSKKKSGIKKKIKNFWF